MIDVIYLAAGQGKRVGLGYPKQFARLGGTPIIIHALEVFQVMEEVGRIIVPCADLKKTWEYVDSYGIRKAALIPGGETRQESVYEALRYINTEEVLVHEAVRPFITEAFVRRIINTKGEAVTPRRQSMATIIDNDGRCYDRDFFGEVQMPQKYRTSVLRGGHTKAHVEKLDNYTDDAAIVYYMHSLTGSVTVVDGLENNIKITTPLDLLFAEAMVNARCSDRE